MAERVCIVGSGNWGSAIARVVGENVLRHGELFQREVRMWVNQETVNGQLLTDLINNTHQNVKYLPGITLPSNVIADEDLLRTVAGCSILIIVVPHQFVESVCGRLKGKVSKDAKVISLVKGLDTTHGLQFLSDVIGRLLGTDVSVLMGANVADEVALGKFCETTIASKNPEHSKIFKILFENPNFLVDTIDDVIGTELCGALKNVVAVAAGFSDGLGWGSNTKAAVIRIGLTEMRRFAHTFYKGVQDSTFFESCGVGDLLTTCYGGRNHRLSREFVRQKKSFEVLEKEMLNGQKLQGPLTAKEVNKFLKEKKLEKEFPLFTTVYRISYEGLDPAKLLGDIQSRL